MKKTGKIFVSMTSLGLLLNNVAFAATEVAEEESGFSTKYIFMGVAVLIIVLLLYLGYKMDTKGNEKATKVSQKAKKEKQKLTEKAEEIKQNSGTYEADEGVTYEEDKTLLENEDLNEVVEYDEDEDSLFEVSNEEEPSIYEEDPVENNKVETVPEPEPEPEEEGEEFDVSIIDNLDDEETIEPAEPVEDKKTSDETILFDSNDLSNISVGNDIDNSDELNALEEEGNKDTFIEELKNFEEPENNFEGFTSGTTSIEVEDKDIEKEPKKYTKVKKDDNVGVEMPDIPADDDFLSQLEANLEKNKADRNARKNSSSKSSTTTKKTTTKKKEN